MWMWQLDHKEDWELKNWCFWIVVLEKTLEGPLDFRETKPVNPKGNQSEYVSERLMLKLKLQYFGHLVWIADSLEKTLMLGKTEGRRRRRWQRMRWLNSITDSMDMNLSKLRDSGGQRSLAWSSQWGCRVKHDLVTEQLLTVSIPKCEYSHMCVHQHLLIHTYATI